MALKEAAKPKMKVTPGDEPPAPEVLAQAVVDISTAMKRLSASRLNRKAIVLLVAHSSRCRQGDVEAVLTALDDLEADYLKPKRS